jgi:L-seryl-tRNA(Ser) seleniumtransferase
MSSFRTSAPVSTGHPFAGRGAVKSRRDIPSVDGILSALGETHLPRPLVVECIRTQLAALRKSGEIPETAGVVRQIEEALRGLRRSRIQSVINGTGIVIHTNLGRSPLGQQAVAEMTRIARAYGNLEFDLNRGVRGSRAAYLEQTLAILCRAEAATVVNNGAAALILILSHLCRGERKEVVISRGELIQIGGGFRIPEILESSGGRLREVGTTNKTSLEDYESAIGTDTALILKVHRSNFFMEGFVASPSIDDLAVLAKRKKVPLVEDLGSGAVIETERLAPMEHEPTPAESLRRGVHLLCFSGDKLLGGPQAGIIAGKRRLVRVLKKEPLFRALRCDKLILTALQATVEEYLGTARSETPNLPVLRMLNADHDALRGRAEQIVAQLNGSDLEVTVGISDAQVGGGSLPKSRIPSITVDLSPAHGSVKDFAARLREGEPPVIGTIAGGNLKLDLRTVFPEQDDALARVVRQAVYPYT